MLVLMAHQHILYVRWFFKKKCLDFIKLFSGPPFTQGASQHFLSSPSQGADLLIQSDTALLTQNALQHFCAQPFIRPLKHRWDSHQEQRGVQHPAGRTTDPPISGWPGLPPAQQSFIWLSKICKFFWHRPQICRWNVSLMNIFTTFSSFQQGNIADKLPAGSHAVHVWGSNRQYRIVIWKCFTLAWHTNALIGLFQGQRPLSIRMWGGMLDHSQIRHAHLHHLH